MNILHATSTPPLLDRFKEMLKYSYRADIAVGYLFVSGFNAVADELGKLEKTRVLVGKVDRPTLDEIARGVQQAEAIQAQVASDSIVKRSARGEIGASAVTTIAEGVARMPQTDGAQESVRRIRDLIAGGTLEIKTYPKGVLHAKAYLCWYKDHADPGSAIIGSSNFTLAGFTGNTELNVRVTGDAEMAELRRWFDALWDESVDVTQDVAVELTRSCPHAQTPPYHVYLKALYELYKDELGERSLEPKKRGAPELANFQLDAVRRGLRMVERHGGCFVGDVVGLGKTYVGAELVRQLQFTEPPGRHPLIVCPAGLVSMWEGIAERFGIGAEVVSMSAIGPPPALAFDEEHGAYVEDVPTGPGVNLQQAFPNRGVVLVDEVHNFRNPASRRYAALSRYLWGGDHRVVLLSATPQNLGPADIYHQLRLFLDALTHGLDLEPLHLENYFRAVQRWYEYRVGLENWKEDYQRWQAMQGLTKGKPQPPPIPPDQPREPFASIEQVLNPTFIRRRKDISELYGDDVEVAGKRVRFPEPVLENVAYRLDKVYARAGDFSWLLQRLEAHRGARYLAHDYLHPHAQDKDDYKDLLRARNRIARLVRFLLFKRLESSVAAFRATLDTLHRSNRNFRQALQEGVVPIGQTATNVLAGERFSVDELLERLNREEARRRAAGAQRQKLVHPAADFDVPRWIAGLDADDAILEQLRESVGKVTPDDDDKLRELRAFMARPEVTQDKLLIFSEAEATVDYLHAQLNPGGADPSIEHLSGANRDALPAIVKRFAPKTNLREKEKMPGPPVRVLIATDVISEGQNLQDCARVLNYDLHWNPVRLIQRFGRVDRIGTEHDQIFLHNTWPDTQVDAQLTLTERLRNRIQAFHDFIGLDAPLLSDTERLNPGAMYRIYQEKRLPDQDDVLDDVAAFQRGVTLLQKLAKDDPELWKTVTNLPDGIRSAVPARVPSGKDLEQMRFESMLAGVTTQQALFPPAAVQLPLGSPQFEASVEQPLEEAQPGETVVLFKHGDRAASYAVGANLKPRLISPNQLITAVECAPETPAAPLPPDTNKRVMAAYEATRQQAETRLGRARRTGADTNVRRYLARELRLARREFVDDPEELARIDLLRQIFLGYLRANVQPEVDEVYRMRLTGESLLRRLDALRERHRLTTASSDETDAPAAATEVVRIICSDALT